MRFLYSLLFVLLVAASSMAIISQDQRSGINGYAQKTALVDVPGEIQPEGVTGQPRFVKQTNFATTCFIDVAQRQDRHDKANRSENEFKTQPEGPSRELERQERQTLTTSRRRRPKTISARKEKKKQATSSSQRSTLRRDSVPCHPKSSHSMKIDI
ncbi:hypothetical protein L3Y34_007972 [Caenorhabditis briggsae]|uniref:Secreted protein n=1 Tax=Caenorhabditis briggsae TaxID=6238 RepID=A0AAE9CZJ6_CAEBR|nr:hypothetical protein L3Y34_007972 [Caenorhabditis briggsae]